VRPPRHVLALTVVIGLVLVGTQCTPGSPSPSVVIPTGFVVADGPGGALSIQQVQVSNDGPEPIKLALSEGSPHFRLEYAANMFACEGYLSPDGRFLQPRASCSVEVWFDPLSAGEDHRATLVVTGTPGGKSELLLRGRAYVTSAPAAGVASVR
jgi:hypothetical protein